MDRHVRVQPGRVLFLMSWNLAAFSMEVTVMGGGTAHSTVLYRELGLFLTDLLRRRG